MSEIFSKTLSLLKKKSIRGRIITLVVTYTILIAIGFVYLYPMIKMILKSFFSPEALVDPTVDLLPLDLYFGNYVEAYNTLDFLKSFGSSFGISAVSAILQCLTASIIGFGFARFNFPLKKLLLVLIVATFIIPTQVTLVPRYVLFETYGIIETVWPAFLPALLGQGIKSALFILIFVLYFSSYPVALDEAAAIDGANKIKVFYKIAIPMASSAIILTLLFSFIWYWNETSQFNMFFEDAITTMPMKLQQFTAIYEALYGGAGSEVAEASQAVVYAGTTLSVLPILIMYLCLQRQFTESIEKTGIVG